MDEHSFRVLEFPAVLALLGAEAASVLGRQRAAALRPAVAAEEIDRRLAETTECRRLLTHGPLGGLAQAADIRAARARAAVAGSRLTPAELLAVADTLEAGLQLRRQLKQAELSLPRLTDRLAGLRPPAEVAARIRQCLQPDGSMGDGASPELARLRARARQLREEVRETLQGVLASPRMQPVIAEPVITLRNDRYVIPVTASYQPLLQGVVQDQSGSGQTLFLEPLAVVELNNRIRRAEREADEEVDRILGALTDAVREHGEAIDASVEALADFDLILARARLAERWGAAEPQVRPGGELRLLRARHPLLLEARRGAAGAEVVPIDVCLPAGVRCLAITGPNTGGKTVALKTVGLAVLMAQAGMHLPASPDSSLPRFGAVYADIGDEQSIAQDLSTFSAHVSRLCRVLEASEATTLVLLDELGAGTDPVEGAALGSAVLEALAARGCQVLATTHLDGIKLFVAQDPRMVNGAVEFDLDRLRPAYTVHIGLPGRSFAIDIASRLGLPPATIARARELTGDSTAGVTALLDRLQALERTRSQEAEAALREREAAGRSREAAERLQEDLAARRAALQARGERVVSEIAAEARRRVEAAMAALQQDRGAQAARQAIAGLRQVAAAGLETLPAVPPPAVPPGPPAAAEPGERVWVRHLGQVGTVLAPAGPAGLVEVQLGVGRVRVPREMLRPAAAPAAPSAPAIGWNAGAGDALQAEIKVIGRTVEEATSEVGHYLDDAMLGGLTRVRIIHGKGTGRLRRGLEAFLRTHPLVAGFQLASLEEGGAGVTVVDLGGPPLGLSAGEAGPPGTGEA